jgi:2-oxoglutarate/2-oxoacid ferredoxin oxidoreductase subunit alpha
VLEAQDRLKRHGVKADVLRIRSFPFHPSVKRFLERHERIFVVEQNRDAQLRALLAVETEVPITSLTSLRFYGGLPLSWGPVVEGVLRELGVEPAVAPRLEVAG